MKKFLCCILAVILILGTTACKKTDGSQSNEGPAVITPETYDTVHEFDVTDGSVDLVSDGTSDFTIVYPYEWRDDDDLQLAVEELILFFRQATGITLPAVADTEKTDAQNILSIGQTAQMKADAYVSDRLAAAEVKSNGYIIETRDSAVYMTGDTALGALFAVYGFLEWQFNYHIYKADEIRIDTNVTDAKLKVMHITDIPDVEYRIFGFGCNGRWDQRTLRRMRLNTIEEVFNTEGIEFIHNYFDYFPVGEYGETNPEWYSPDLKQLCLTRDPDGLRQALVPKLIEKLEAQPKVNNISFTANDGGTWCTCGKCKEDAALYDDPRVAFTAGAIEFMNAVARDLKAWNERECPERNIRLLMFCYGAQRIAPVKLDENKKPVEDENGNYLPYDDKFILEDNIGVIFCHSSKSAYYKMGEHESSDSELEELKRWKALTDDFLFWTYSTLFDDYWLPIDSVEKQADDVRFVYKNNGFAHFHNTKMNDNESTDWTPLKAYLESQLRWNFQLDVNELIDDFFDNYYKEAAPVMKRMFAEYRDYFAYLAYEKNLIFAPGNGKAEMTRENWPYKRLTQFLDYIDEAMAVIESLDTATHDLLYNRILMESIAYRYLILELYPETMTFETLDAYKHQLSDDCIMLNINRKAELEARESYFGY